MYDLHPYERISDDFFFNINAGFGVTRTHFKKKSQIILVFFFWHLNDDNVLA